MIENSQKTTLEQLLGYTPTDVQLQSIESFLKTGEEYTLDPILKRNSKILEWLSQERKAMRQSTLDARTKNSFHGPDVHTALHPNEGVRKVGSDYSKRRSA